MNKRLILIILLFFTFAAANAQKRFEYVDSTLMYEQQEKVEKDDEEYNDYTTEETDDDIQGDTGVSLRAATILKDSIDFWKNKKEFAYAKNLDSLLKAKQEEGKKDNSRSSPTTERRSKPANMDKLFAAGWIQAVLWTLAALFVLYILYRLFLSDVRFRKSSSAQQVKEMQPVEEEFQLLSNFDQLIHQSCKLGDYRVATRYLFLKTLQRLRDKSLIEYSIDKTNYKYLYELPENKRESFASLIMTYEYLWYGHNEVEKEDYTAIETNFNNFLNKI
ncbi:DUF4129 domain-containing protein [Ferruginibacter sp. HRS2-29]|uniref:DUF4129 domain-containing protein n=1 Tax=Ferruginibacter sp. HRS2-29 TaxID=2487334 RepID=UPI0020CC779E|nr:DUF4129 domain-containing protein [Ferruginibacter sp. HRS2-29]MCP9752493.1 DUF4129 domain-containing protein [Ferruginibacter sp. HRS2-29]